MRYVEPDFGVLSVSEKRKITHLREDLLGWFSRYGRNLPWRSARAPEFEQICVEVLLQRTRAETVAAMYPNFFAQFKNWSDLADASIRELEEQLKPIGLWRRRAISIKGLATGADLNDLLAAVCAFKEELAVAGIDCQLAQIQLRRGWHLCKRRSTVTWVSA